MVGDFGTGYYVFEHITCKRKRDGPKVPFWSSSSRNVIVNDEKNASVELHDMSEVRHI